MNGFKRMGRVVASGVLASFAVGAYIGGLPGDRAYSSEFAAKIGPQTLERVDRELKRETGLLARRLDATRGLSRRDLQRADALLLLRKGFGHEIESVKSPLEDVQVNRFVDDSTAIVVANRRGSEGKRALLASSMPLRVETKDGAMRRVDLDLERAPNGVLKPAQALSPISIPSELGDGMRLLGDETIGVFVNGVRRSTRPTIVKDGEAAVYPNVATDTDFVVTPTPGGFETFTHLRTARSPAEQSFSLDVPEGAVLEKRDSGAVVTKDGNVIMEITEPLAVDAAGKSVPVAMSVEGSNVNLKTSLSGDVTYPVLVDPVFSTFDWSDYGTIGDSAWTFYSKGTNNFAPVEVPGALGVFSLAGHYSSGSVGDWIYRVPRYDEDYSNLGVRPTSFIQSATLDGMRFLGGSSHPLFWAGTVKEGTGLFGVSGYPLSVGSFYTYSVSNQDPTLKSIFFGLATVFSDTTLTPSQISGAHIEYASIAVSDNGVPGFGSITSPGWVDQIARPVKYTVSDSGLGIYSVFAMGTDSNPLIHPDWSATASSRPPTCLGTSEQPCPRTWTSNDAILYDPATMESGIHTIKLFAFDPLLQTSAPAFVKIRVDHTDPILNPISGTITEAVGLNSRKPSYTVQLSSTDGGGSGPQSGVETIMIEVDGAVVETIQSDCTGNSCALDGEWILRASEYAAGSHTLSATAVDRVGRRSESRTLGFEIGIDDTAPDLVVSGALANSPDGWVEQETYGLDVAAHDDGHGVTRVEVFVDEQEPLWSPETLARQDCDAGGCSLGTTFEVDMAEFSGGSHEVSIVAEDGAGNEYSETFTVNVNPAGTQVPVDEVIDTLQAVDTTGNSNVVGPSEYDLEYQGATEDVGFVEEGSAVEAAGGAVPLSVDIDNEVTVTTTVPSEGLGASEEGSPDDLGDEDGAEIAMVPMFGGSPELESVVGENGVVAANSAVEADTVVRPLFDGAIVFQMIRSSESPNSYSWEVSHDDDQILFQEPGDDQHVQLTYADGTPAMTIVAESAHDATGAIVPTRLILEDDNIVTLEVDHRQPEVVYPVVAGPGWEAASVTSIVSTETLEPVPDPDGAPPLPEETMDVGEAVFLSAPAPDSLDPEWYSNGCRTNRNKNCPMKRRYAFVRCIIEFFGPGGQRSNLQQVCRDTPTGNVSFAAMVHGKFSYKYGKWVRIKPGNYHSKIYGTDKNLGARGPLPIRNHDPSSSVAYTAFTPDKLFAYGTFVKRENYRLCWKIVGLLPSRPPKGDFPSREASVQLRFSRFAYWRKYGGWQSGTYEQLCGSFESDFDADG